MSELFLVFAMVFLGFMLLLIEIFVIPGFGFTGAAGLLCLVLGSVFAFYRLSPAAGAAVTVITLAAFVIMLKVFSRTVMRRWINLDKTTSKSDGYSATKDFGYLLGKKGIVVTALRPVGTVIIDDERQDVVSEMGMIDKDEEVIVVKVEGNRIVVERTM